MAAICARRSNIAGPAGVTVLLGAASWTVWSRGDISFAALQEISSVLQRLPS